MLLLHLVGCLYYCIYGARSHKHQIYTPVSELGYLTSSFPDGPNLLSYYTEGSPIKLGQMIRLSLIFRRRVQFRTLDTVYLDLTSWVSSETPDSCRNSTCYVLPNSLFINTLNICCCTKRAADSVITSIINKQAHRILNVISDDQIQVQGSQSEPGTAFPST